MRIILLSLLLSLAACSSASIPATQPATMPAPGRARFNIAAGVVQGLAEENHTLPLAEWPLYHNTNLPVIPAPDELRQHVKENPKFSGPDLGFYRVMIMKIEGQPSYVFYHADSKTLVLVPIP
jgi:hypothetical protein